MPFTHPTRSTRPSHATTFPAGTRVRTAASQALHAAPILLGILLPHALPPVKGAPAASGVPAVSTGTVGNTADGIPFATTWEERRKVLWEAIAPHFQPPAGPAAVRGSFRTPLRFQDGRPVTRPEDWPARRAEILAAWHAAMGPWPELLAAPRVEVVREEMRGDLRQRTVRVEVAKNVFQDGFILLPPGNGPRPAVFVPFYTAETSVNYQGPMTGLAKTYADTGRVIHRDFAYGLARRGFVTLAIGCPGGDAYKPVLGEARCQPLSYLAYIAANCHTVLAHLPQVDPLRIGVMGHSYGGKWALFASCLYDKYACAVWSDAGVVFDEQRGSVNYWEPWYLGLDPSTTRARGLLTEKSPRTGAYRRLVAEGRDLVELHALMAPRPFLVSGGSEDGPGRWAALDHAVAVNRLLGFDHRVAMTFRPAHAPTGESNGQAYQFLEYFLGPADAGAPRP